MTRKFVPRSSFCMWRRRTATIIRRESYDVRNNYLVPSRRRCQLANHHNQEAHRRDRHDRSERVDPENRRRLGRVREGPDQRCPLRHRSGNAGTDANQRLRPSAQDGLPSSGPCVGEPTARPELG